MSLVMAAASSRAGRVSPAILGAAAAIGLGLVVVGIHVTQLNAQLASKQQMIATLTSDNAQIQQQVAALQQTRQELEGRLSDLQTQVASATAELSRLRELEPPSPPPATPQAVILARPREAVAWPMAIPLRTRSNAAPARTP